MSETRRFRTQGKVEALLYHGSFPLDFLRRGESVGAVPGARQKGSCQIDYGDGESTTLEPGELLIRDLDARLYVLTEETQHAD